MVFSFFDFTPVATWVVGAMTEVTVVVGIIPTAPVIGSVCAMGMYIFSVACAAPAPCMYICGAICVCDAIW